MPKEVARISKNYMTDPLEVSIGHKNQSNENIEHIYFVVKERDRYAALKRLIDFNPDIFGLVFCRTRRETQQVAEKLGKEGYNSEALHGDLSQAQRDRVMKRFRSKSIQLLVATDVAARGIDVDNLTHVINFSVPESDEAYTHRCGRTGRKGQTGKAITLAVSNEIGRLKRIMRTTGFEVQKKSVPDGKNIAATKKEQFTNKLTAVEQLPLLADWFAYPGENGLAVTQVIYDYTEEIATGDADDMGDLQEEMMEEINDLL